MMNLVGQTLGQYRIEVLLDSGGMGSVFRGVHLYLERPAAIKVMRENLASTSQFQARFLQEARAAAALKHPNIVDIYEFGEHNGLLYLVMELMTAGSLRTLLQRRATGQPWPLSLGLDLVRQAAEGLAAAHAQGVIHRDIKPDNLMLNRASVPGRPGEQYQLKITDFGLARLAESSGLTAAGATMGTLAYMSPEQAAGEQVDGRTDIYALGVVLYEVATGYLPFQIENYRDALYKHTNVVPPSPRQVRPDVPQEVEEIIYRCLAKKPADRYATGTDLARDLQRTLGMDAIATVAPISLTSGRGGVNADRTALQTPPRGVTPAPAVSALSQLPSAPQVRVLDQSGNTLQVAVITSRGLTVGRQVGSDIVLPTQEVSRQHLQVQWDGRQATVKDLGSSNGTVLNGTRLVPQTNYPWQDRQQIHLGPFWLRLEGAAGQQLTEHSAPTEFEGRPTNLAGTNLVASSTRTAYPPETYTQRAQNSSPTLDGGRIGMSIEPATLTIVPGQPAGQIRVQLTNKGNLVDWFTTTVEGVPGEWVMGAGNEVQLNPGSQEQTLLSVNVARTPNNRAQEYPVTIRARSREKPSESATVHTRWTVLPYKEDSMKLEPRRATGRRGAAYAVILRNDGNALAHYELSGEDDEQKLNYQFRQDSVDLDAGREARIPFRIEDHSRFIGREQRQPFQIQARPTGSSIPLMGSAEFVNKPLLPPWVLTVAAVVLVVGALLLDTILGVIPFPGRQQMGDMLNLPMANTTGMTTANATATAAVMPTPTPTPGTAATATAQTAGATATAAAMPTPTPTPTTAAAPTAVPTVTASTAMLRAGFAFDFDRGLQPATTTGGDVLWNVAAATAGTTTTTGMLQPNGKAQLANIGNVDFNGVTLAQLKGLNYSTTPLNGTGDTTGQLVTNDVFAVKTNGGNFAKVLIINYGNTLEVQWVTFKG